MTTINHELIYINVGHKAVEDKNRYKYTENEWRPMLHWVCSLVMSLQIEIFVQKNRKFEKILFFILFYVYFIYRNDESETKFDIYETRFGRICQRWWKGSGIHYTSIDNRIVNRISIIFNPYWAVRLDISRIYRNKRK